MLAVLGGEVCVEKAVLWRPDFEAYRLVLLCAPGPKRCKQMAATPAATGLYLLCYQAFPTRMHWIPVRQNEASSVKLLCRQGSPEEQSCIQRGFTLSAYTLPSQ